LKLMPFWDPLRGDPRFAKLLEESKKPIELKWCATQFSHRTSDTSRSTRRSSTRDQRSVSTGRAVAWKR